MADAPSTSNSRRDFLMTSSVAAVGAVAGSLSVARSAYAAGSDEIKIGLIGCGGRGRARRATRSRRTNRA